MISVAIFYALATLVAVGLSYKKGGPIAIAAMLISVMWFFQIALYFMSGADIGDMIGPMINGALMLCIALLPGARQEKWSAIVLASLFCQLVIYWSDTLTGLHSDLAINVLYIVQLFALGWSGGRIVLVGLGAWMASVWNNRSGVYGWASRVGMGLWAIVSAGWGLIGVASRNPTALARRGCNRSVDVGSGCVLHLSIEKGGRSE